MNRTVIAGVPVLAFKRCRRGLMWLSLLALLGLVGAGNIHVSLAGASTGRQMAPAPGGSGGDGGPTSVRIVAPTSALALYPAPGTGGGGDPGPVD